MTGYILGTWACALVSYIFMILPVGSMIDDHCQERNTASYTEKGMRCWNAWLTGEIT